MLKKNLKNSKNFAKLLVCACTLLTLAVTSVTAAADSSSLLAFPGAQGGGKYSPGARGILDEGGTIEVYHVTNLNDSGEGSFRDAVSKSGRIVVFDTSGTVELSSQAAVSSNVTVLAQTAPGDGITISGADVLVESVSNVILRYLKVRPTDKNGGEYDGLGGRFSHNVIFDNCSVSWCVDELLTLYGGTAQNGADVGSELTIQNTIGSESLRMSSHPKGAHGYGAIWGGTNASYIDNLLAHHDSRSPRMDRQLQKTDVNNNIIYDWGQTNSAYGAEPYSTDHSMHEPSIVNWIGNYYKAGPATAKKLLTRIFDVTGPDTANGGTAKSQFYFSDNYLEGTGFITDYKNNSYVNNYEDLDFLDTEVDMGEYTYEQRPVLEVKDDILANAGATLPRRDATDARIVNDVKNGTGRLVNSASEVGGLIPIDVETRVFTIPDEWLSENGLTGKAETDIIESGEFAGYTVIEAYVNDWTDEQSKIAPTNPNIVVQSPAISALSDTIEGLSVDNGEWTVITDGETVNYKATAIAQGGNEVTKMELYDGNTKIAEYDGSSIDDNISLEAGEHYLTCRAINSIDEKTQSTTSIVYVKPAAEPGSYSYTEIRESSYSGYKNKGGASMDERGVYTICGSGRLTTKSNDNCGFMYKEVTGDFDISVKVEDIPKFENQQVSGLMVRAGLEKDDIMAMIADGWIKYGENVRVLSRNAKKASATETYFSNASGTVCENDGDNSYDVPKYMRIQRSGNTLTFTVSNSSSDWSDNEREPMTITYDSLPDTMYVGIATDSANGVSVKEYFSMAKFSHLTLNGESDVTVEEGAVPFYDTSFDSTDKPEWYIPNGSGNTDLSQLGLGGNYSEALLFWGETSRTFKTQKHGVVSITADVFTRKHESNTGVNNAAAFMFTLNGSDGSETSSRIANFYMSRTLGIYTNADVKVDSSGNVVLDGRNPQLTDSSVHMSDTKYDLNKWYKITATLDYYTGKGNITLAPYTEYSSLTETYTTGDAILDYDFDFDTSVGIDNLKFERYAGWEMYLDNVGLSAEIRPVLIQNGSTLTVDRPEKDGSLFFAGYGENGELTLFDNSAGVISKDETKEFAIPAGASRAFLFTDTLEPLCDALDIE